MDWDALTYQATDVTSAVSHIQDFGDATTSSTGDAASLAGDAGVGVGDAHLSRRSYISSGE